MLKRLEETTNRTSPPGAKFVVNCSRGITNSTIFEPSYPDPVDVIVIFPIGKLDDPPLPTSILITTPATPEDVTCKFVNVLGTTPGPSGVRSTLTTKKSLEVYCETSPLTFNPDEYCN